MQNSGDSEFSGNSEDSNALNLTFWQSFILTLSGVAGLIALVAGGPVWISVSGFTLVIVLLVWLMVSQLSKKKRS